MLRIPAPVNEEKIASSEHAKKSDSKKAVQTVADKSDKGAFEWYEVRKGDTLSKIARKELGNERLVNEISKLNKLNDKKSLKVGSKIRLPSKTVLSGESTAALTTRGLENAEP
jgi:nucleoid-associated protein YgaU